MTFRYILDNLVGRPDGRRLVDLGAGHCVFSRIAAHRGFVVTAVDGRDERKPNELKGIAFVKSDVRQFEVAGFDVILIIGLLYHLTLEDQIELLSRCPRASIIIVDTQVHIPSLIVDAAARGRFVSRPVSKRGYDGVLYPEIGNAQASIGNDTSWWHTEESLLKLYRNTGFVDVVQLEPPYVSTYGARRWQVLRKE